MTPFQNPTIYIGDLRIDEPITTITDLFFISVCVYAFINTKHISNSKGLKLYRWFFLFTGISTLIAALVGHAFLYYFGTEAKMYGWVTGILGTSFAQFAALYHTNNSIKKSTFKALVIVCSIEVVAAFFSLFVYWSFIVVEIHSAFVLILIVTIMEYLHYKKTKSTLSLFMIYGVGVAIIAVLCHIFKLAFSVWFNHLDLSHIFMAISMFLMYKGVSSYQIKETQIINNII